MWKKIFGGGKTAREEKAPANQNPLYDRINWQRLPRHVAIIMDGNGRWAQGKGLIRTAGHKAGVKTLKNILKAAIDLRIEALTVYAFSTENWKRPRPEVEFLMKLFSEYLIKELEEMNDYNVRIRFIGRMAGMPEGLQRQMREAEALMKDNTGIRFNVAANYGGQDELIRAAQSLAREAAAGRLPPRTSTPRPSISSSTRLATRPSTSSSARAATSASRTSCSGSRPMRSSTSPMSTGRTSRPPASSTRSSTLPGATAALAA